MNQIRVDVTGAAVALALVLIGGGRIHAQQPRTGVTAGVAVATEYPDRFQDGCGDYFSAAPFVQVHHRIHRLLTGELGVSAQMQFPPFTHCSAEPVPLGDGQVVRAFRSPTGRVSLAAETRLVLTPLPGEDGRLRVIGGGAWYPARTSPAWIVGIGYRPPVSWGALVLDVERWNVGVAYDLERYRVGAPREPLGEGREWQRFWQLRAGLTLFAW